MASHPLMIAGLLMSALAVVGIVAAVMRESRLFNGFRDIAPEVKTLSNHLRAEVFRDRYDLVVSGEYKGIPAVIRFSKHKNVPAMGLYVRIPAACQLSLVPNSLAGKSLSSNIKLNSRFFEEHFVARSMSPHDLALLLEDERTLKLLESLCCTTRTIFELNRGRLELLEMVLPEELTRHILGHLQKVHSFADVLAAMPESERVEIRPFKREHRSWLFKAAVAACVAIVAMSVIAATREHKISEVFAANDAQFVRGVPVYDAATIDGMETWRAAKPEEMSPKFSDWLQDSGQQPAVRIEFKPVANGLTRGVAYLLVRDDGSRRLVILIDHHAVFDACFARVDGIALVPLTSFPKLKWGQWQAPTQKPNGDAILVVRDAADPRSAELLFFPNGTLFSGVPRDYSTIDFDRGN